jgi:hypothetical protein
MPSDNKSSNLKTRPPEMRERSRIMSRMKPEEKKAYRWKCYDETAKPKLLELIEYCQSDNRIFPYTWGKIYNDYAQFSNRHSFTEYPPFRPSLILGASLSPDILKRQRLLTQIYWCYKNLFIGSVYDTIMKTPIDDWEIGRYQEDKISLELIKKEYASWLGVNYHPEHDIWNHCTDYDKKRKQIERAEEIYDNQEDILDDESTTSIKPR